MMVDAITQRDYPMVQVLVTLEGIGVVVGNLAVGVMYGWLGPRIRYDQMTPAVANK